MNPIIQLHYQFSNYCITFRGYSPRTMKSSFYNIKKFVTSQKIDAIHQISRPMVEQYIIEQKIKRNWSPRTIKNNIQNLHTFLEYCVEERILPENPIKGIPIPKQRKALPKALKKEDAIRVLEWTYATKFFYKFNKIRARAIIATFLFTGVRLSELINLKVSDIRIYEGMLRVECGKGGKDRLIPINPRLVDILKEYLQARNKNKKECLYFFIALREDKKIHTTTIRRLFKKIKTDLQINVYPHKLRHTCATLLLQGSCDIYSLSKMLGHSDIKTTTIYLGLTTGHLKEQVNKHPLGFREELPHRKFL